MLRYTSDCLFSCAALPWKAMLMIDSSNNGWSSSMRGLPAAFRFSFKRSLKPGSFSHAASSLFFLSSLLFFDLLASSCFFFNRTFNSSSFRFLAFNSISCWSLKNPADWRLSKPTKSALIKLISFSSPSWTIALRTTVELVAAEFDSSSFSLNCSESASNWRGIGATTDELAVFSGLLITCKVCLFQNIWRAFFFVFAVSLRFCNQASPSANKFSSPFILFHFLLNSFWQICFVFSG